jgi:hypothetical protein
LWRWNNSMWGQYLWGNSMAGGLLWRFYSFGAFKDILQRNKNACDLSAWVQFVFWQHAFIRLILLLFFVKFSRFTSALLYKSPYQILLTLMWNLRSHPAVEACFCGRVCERDRDFAYLKCQSLFGKIPILSFLSHSKQKACSQKFLYRNTESEVHPRTDHEGT